MDKTEIGPKQVQRAIMRGKKRMLNFRSARVQFIRQYVGQFYDKGDMNIGAESMNLIFNAVRALVPHIVMNFPKHSLETPYLSQRQYGDLLGMALSQHDKKINIKNAYRQCIVDAIFTLGIMKSGLAQSDNLYLVDPNTQVDPGMIYSSPVDFENFIPDPSSREHMFADASFLGDIVTYPRDLLLGSGLFKNDLIERLPRASVVTGDRTAHELSMKTISEQENFDLEDSVSVAQIWIPAAKAIIYVPATEDVSFDDYLRVDDYYGPREGPYTLLALTPPVPGNPMPVPMVGVWYDLHVLANKMANKIIEQAIRQKDVVVYRPAAADDAVELRDAADGETVSVDDPDSVRVVSFGGQKNSNEEHLAQLQMWFNYMAGNPDQLAGAQDNSSTATQATILANNSNVNLDDMKDLVYQFAADEARKRAWYIDADPMMNIPLAKRNPQPAQFIPLSIGPFMTQPAQMQEEQVMLTPELRDGDFLDFNFSIEPESMGRRDSTTRFAQAMDFAVKLLPAVASAAQIMMSIGLPFSAKAYLLRMAKYAGIDWLDEVFYDPEFQMQMQAMQMMGPQQEKAQIGGGEQTAQTGPGLGQPNMIDQIAQNGQPASVGAGVPSPQTQMMSGFQQGANPGQAMVQRGY